MKKFIFMLAMLPVAASAQQLGIDSTAISSSGSISGSQSGATAISGGGAGGVGVGGVGAANFTVVPQSSVSINSTGSDLGDSVPLVTAPQMTVLGGDDSCLKSRSGGGAISGFGASFGTMVMDNECNRRRMHSYLATSYPDVAMEILCGSPIVWAAFNREAEARGKQSPCDNSLPDSANEIQAHWSGYEEPTDVGPVPLLGPDLPAEDFQDKW